jgi:EF hand
MKKLLTLTAITLTLASSSAFAYNDNDGMSYKEGIQHHFARMDVNDDGYVSRAEHQAATNNMFNEADSNHDNILNHDEFWNHKKRYHSESNRESHTYYNGTSGNYDSNIVDHNMDPRYYNNKRSNRVNDTEDNNKPY